MISSLLYLFVVPFLIVLPSLVISSNSGVNSYTLDNYPPFARVVANGESCSPPTTNCGDRNALCVRKPYKMSGYCKCAPGYHLDRKTYKCIQAIPIGEICSSTQECLIFDRYSYCDFAQLVRKRKPICACQSKHVYSHEKHKCVHCRTTLTDCRDPSTLTSANSLTKYKFALLIKIILIVIGFSLLLSLTFCFFIKILNGYSKSRRSSALNRTNIQSIIATTPPPPMGSMTMTTPPPAAPLQPLPLSSSSFHPFPPLPPPIPPNAGQPMPTPPPPGIISDTNGRDTQVHFYPPNSTFATAPILSHGSSKNGRNHVNSANSDQRLLFASSSAEDKPPSYEEAVHGSISSSKRNLLISLNPNSSLKGNPV